MANKQEVQSYPSYNPADLSTTAGTLDYIFRCNSMSTENCIPAIVESYDRKNNIVTAKPALNITAATGETIERESITATVLSICGGDFIINFPLKKGDTGWLISADRDISLFREQRKIINANTNRIHSIEDSFFIPDRVNNFKVEAEDENNLIIQTLNQNIKISVGKNNIKIRARAGGNSGGNTNNATAEENNSESQNKNSEKQSNTATIFITSEGVETEASNIKCKCNDLTAEVQNTATIKAQNIILDADVTCKKNLTVEGNINCNSNITGSAVKAGSIDLAGHVHGGVESGSSTTGGAQ